MAKECRKSIFSTGGGFVATEEERIINKDAIATPYPCHQAAEIPVYCDQLGIQVSDLVFLNEKACDQPPRLSTSSLHLGRNKSLYI